MKVALSVIRARRQSLAEMLDNHRYLPLAEVCSRLGVSEATARRDLRALAREKQITRTYGGALGTLDAALVSFAERRGVGRSAKARIAARAHSFIRPGLTCFFDSGTTIFALAEALYREPVESLCAVTNSLPVAEMLGRRQQMEVHLLGGRFLQRQSILLGETANRSARDWTFDIVFLGAEGLNARGVWASRPEVAAFQRALVAQAKKVVVCAHAAKIGRATDNFVSPWHDKFQIVTDAPPALRARHGLPI